jgi:hypothetical protein
MLNKPNAVGPPKKKLNRAEYDALSLATRMDFANYQTRQDGRAPDALRSDYPPGYEVGSQLPENLDPAAVVAYVDSYSTRWWEPA